MRPFQKINHFPGMSSVARKNLLARNLNKMAKSYEKEYAFYPMTWQLPAQFSAFRAYFQSVEKGKCRTYIVKPQAFSQGRGIFLTRNLSDMETGAHYVVQRYMTNPLLLNGLKFDLRIYVLVAGSKPLRLYIYEQGLARFATQLYQPPNSENLKDVYRHLTNYAINKNNQKFVFNTSQKKMDVGHKRSLTSVYKVLEEQGQDVKRLKEDIDRVIIKTMIAGQPQLQHQYNACQPQNFMNNICFQILGFDIMLTKGKDKAVKPWLIEVNHLPSFDTDSPLDEFIKKSLLKDTFTLLNLTVQQKTRVFNQFKGQMNTRLYKKKTKFTVAEKAKLFQEAQATRDQFQNSHLGRYRKIFPVAGYDQMLQYSKNNHFTKAKKFQLQQKRKKQELVVQKPKVGVAQKSKEFPSRNTPMRLVQGSLPSRDKKKLSKRVQQRPESTTLNSTKQLTSKQDSNQADERERHFRIRSHKDKLQKIALLSGSRQKLKSIIIEKATKQLKGNFPLNGAFLAPKNYDMLIEVSNNQSFLQRKKQAQAK